jgi:predicted transcriptional regulator of viral defense system
VKPSEWKEDSWIVADALFSPCYIGGWSAAEHWELTDQIFNDIVVCTGLRPRCRHQTIKGINYLLTTVHQQDLWGLVSVWRRNVKISVSSPERTLADILDNPALGGGIKHAAEIVHAYFDGEHRNDTALVECLRKTMNRTVCKRLGFILEILKLNAPIVTTFCAGQISAGYSKLDPSIRTRGRLLRKWNLVVNVELGQRSATL